MKILVIEDDQGLRETLVELLTVSGHEVLAAADGREGVALASQSPDFIFCDVDMPNLDGHGALAEIRKLPRVCDVPFVFLTGRDGRTDLRAGMALGADDYITKPFTSADILGAIAARTTRQRNLREQVRELAARQERESNAQWSHELLTPLNAVLGSLDLIESEVDSISRTELREMLGLIRQGAERQERLARKLIAYFSLEQLVQASPRSASGRCAADAAIITSVGRVTAGKNRERDLVVSAAPGEAAVSEYWLGRAVEELVENAMTFSRAGSPIRVTGAQSGGLYRVIISDQGPGLQPEQRARVGAFAQFDRKVREQQGLGLGLAIVRLIARLAGGELMLRAGSGGLGLEAELRLPLAKA